MRDKVIEVHAMLQKDGLEAIDFLTEFGKSVGDTFVAMTHDGGVAGICVGSEKFVAKTAELLSKETGAPVKEQEEN
jgi:hypothetical protein